MIYKTINISSIMYTLLLLLLSTQSVAQSSSSSNMLPITSGLYGLNITVDNDGPGTTDMRTRSFDFDDGIEVLETFEGESLDNLFQDMDSFTGYIYTSVVNADINFQGVFANIAYPESSSLLTFSIPDLELTAYCFVGSGNSGSGSSGITSGCITEDPRASSSGVFILDGPENRDIAQEELEDFLKDSDLANRLSKLLAFRSPTSPLAGNPSSLQSAQADNAFSKGTDTGSDDGQGQASQDQGQNAQSIARTNNAFPVGVQFGRYRQGGKDVNNHSLPLRYSYEWESGKEISVGLPLSYTTVEDAKIYKIGLDISYTHPINKQWKLTPGLGYGLVGSEDLLTGAQIGSVSLTSLYTLDESIVGGPSWSLSIANMIGHYQSFPIKVGDINIDPDLTNQIIKNGLILDSKKTLFSIPVNIKGYFTDTRFFGDALYSERYDEIGIFFSPAKKRLLGKSQGINISYLFAENDITGFNFAYSYKF